jgi:hypothetical protein
MKPVIIFLLFCQCYLLSAQEGVLIVKRPGQYPNEKYGFEDEGGKEIIPCIYSFAKEFKGNFAIVSK